MHLPDNMAGWNLANQNLSYLIVSNMTTETLANADLHGSNLSSAMLRSATLTNANLQGSNLSSANLLYAKLSDADLRGAIGVSGASLASVSAVTTNTILPDGTINGFNLTAGETLTLRNDADNIPITVLSQAKFNATATLQIVLDGNPWGSTISFASGIPVTLAGELELELAPGVDRASLVGDTFRLFNWTGVSRTGQFSVELPGDPSGWDISKLYTTGEVTVVPEPSTLVLLGIGAVSLLGYGWRKRRRTA